MQSFCLIVFLLPILTASQIEPSTFEKDVDDLEDMRLLVSNSDMRLRGWSLDTDPCGDTLPCGINYFDECNWEGLACVTEGSQYRRIIGIAIEGRSMQQQLRGKLPVRLPEKLQSLMLPGNALKGSLSKSDCSELESTCKDIWWRNTMLTKVNIQANALEGELPEWETLRNLEVIQLSGNQLTGGLPEGWGNKSLLEQIDLSNNQLRGSLPTTWAHLAGLRYIHLAHNLLEHQIPHEWFQLPSLILLDISGNCGICGEVPEDSVFAIHGNGTNLNVDCRSCNGCQCKKGALKFVVTNVLLSITVLAVMLFVWFLYRCLKAQDRPEQLPMTESFPQSMPRKPQENPTIVINPDHDVCFCCKILESTHSSSETEETNSDDLSDGESSDISVGSNSESIDPKVLAFLYKKSPMLALGDRTWSEEIAGPSEVRPEGYASDLDARSSATAIRPRRSKSALEGCSSQKKVSKEFLDSRKSAKRVAELAPTPKRPKNKHRRRRVRTFRRRNRRGLADVNSVPPPPQGKPSSSGGNNK